MILIFIAVILLLILFAVWLEFIPIRLWITKSVTEYYGKKTRNEIKKIKNKERYYSKSVHLGRWLFYLILLVLLSSSVICFIFGLKSNISNTDIPLSPINSKEKPYILEGVCPGQKFIDMPNKNSWAHEGIDFCTELGFMNGMNENIFAPNENATRAEFITILYRMAGCPQIEFCNSFSDVPDGEWYTDAIEWATANSIVTGTIEEQFDPSGNISREQVATFLYRAMDCPDVSGNLSAFYDGLDVHSYAKDSMIWATQEGIINGIKDGSMTKLAPQDTATRAQIASIILRFNKSGYYCY